MDKEAITRGYDQAAEQYLKGRAVFDNLRYLEMVASLLKPGASILDLGCGAGVPTDRLLVNMGFVVRGLDISAKQIELAKRHVPEGTFEVKDMSSLREGEYAVDAVVSLYAIYHTPRESHPALLRKLHSFLPDGGIIFVLMGAKDWEGTKDGFYGVQMSWSMHNPDTNRRIVEDAGFTILVDEIDTAGGERHQAIIARRLPR